MRIKAVFLTSTILFFSACLLADDNPWQTRGLSNGRMWAKLDLGHQAGYVVAAHEAIAFTDERWKTEFSCDCTNEEVVRGITDFYATDSVRNSLPIMLALKMYMWRAKGIPADRIAEEIQKWLRFYSNPATEKKP